MRLALDHRGRGAATEVGADAVCGRAGEHDRDDDRQATQRLRASCDTDAGAPRGSNSAATGIATARATATMSTAGPRPAKNQRNPNPVEASSRASATTVWAAAMPLAVLAARSELRASAASTPSVAA